MRPITGTGNFGQINNNNGIRKRHIEVIKGRLSPQKELL
jgi:hypothetical protein